MKQTLLAEYNGITIGDTVKVVINGQFYADFEEWLDYYGLDKTRYDSLLLTTIITDGIEGTVLAIGKNLPTECEDLRDDILFYIDFGMQNSIVSIDGLKLVKRNKQKNYYIICDGKKHFYIIE